jgi:hypothetical protein
VLGELPRRENVPFKVASIAAAIPADEGFWLMVLMVVISLCCRLLIPHRA